MLVMARRHLTSVHASPVWRPQYKVPEHLNNAVHSNLGYPLDSACPRKARCMTPPSVSRPQSGGTPGRHVNRLRIYEFTNLRAHNNHNRCSDGEPLPVNGPSQKIIRGTGHTGLRTYSPLPLQTGRWTALPIPISRRGAYASSSPGSAACATPVVESR